MDRSSMNINVAYLNKRLTVYLFIISAILFVGAFVTSIHVSPWITFYHEYLMAVSTFFLLLGVFSLGQTLSVSYYFCFLIVTSLIPLSQYFGGVIYFLGDAFIAMSYVLGAAIALLCGEQLSSRNYQEKAIKYFSILLFILGLIHGFFALYQLLDVQYAGPFILDNSVHRVFGNLAQPNNFSTVLSLSLISGVYMFEKKIVSRKVFWLFCGFMLFCIVAVESRTFLLFGFLSFVFFVYICFGRKLPLRFNFYDFLMFALMYCCALLLIELIHSHYFQSPSQSRDMVFQAPHRIKIWLEMIRAIMEGPLWGYGWTQTGVSQVLLEDSYERMLYVRHAHNFFLDLLIWNGPIIGLALVLVVCYWLYSLLIKNKSADTFILMLLGLAIGVHAMVELPLDYTYFIFPLFFILGLLKHPTDNIVSLKSGTFKNVFVVCSLTLYASALIMVHKEFTIIVKDNFKFTITTIFGEQDYGQSELDKIFLLTNLRDELEYKRFELTDNLSEDELEWMRKIAYRYASFSNLSRYLRALEMNEKHERQEEVKKIIVRLFNGQENTYDAKITSGLL